MGALHGNDRPDAEATGAAGSDSRSTQPDAPDRAGHGNADPAAEQDADRAGPAGPAGPADGAVSAPGTPQPAEPERAATPPQYPGPHPSQYQPPQYQPPQNQPPQYQPPQNQPPQNQSPQYQPPQNQPPQYQPPQGWPPQYQPPQDWPPQYQPQYQPPQYQPPQYQSAQYQSAQYQSAQYQPAQYQPGSYPPDGPGGWPAHAGPYTAPPAPRRRGLRSWGAPAPKRTHRWGLGAYVVAEAVFLLVSMLIGYLVVGEGPPPVSMIVLALAAPTVLAAGTALLITRLRGNGPRIDLCFEWSWRDLGLGLAFGFGGLALTIPASIVYVAIVGPDASSAVGDVFGGIRAGPVLAVLVLLIVVFVAPMCEEILYRGLLWGGVERIAGRWAAFVTTTVLFALAHFEFSRTPLLLVVAIPIAVVRLYTGKLLPAIVAHQVNNLLPGVVLMLGLLGVVPMA